MAKISKVSWYKNKTTIVCKNVKQKDGGIKTIDEMRNNEWKLSNRKPAGFIN